MPHISITRGVRGLEVDLVDRGEHVPTAEEIIRNQMAEAAAVRESTHVTRVIAAEDTAPDHLRCKQCEYVAKSIQGLTSHIRNRHAETE